FIDARNGRHKRVLNKFLHGRLAQRTSRLLFSNTECSCESPRISFSVNLSSTDIISPERRKRKDLEEVNCSTEFEFSIDSSVNVNVGFGETLVSADDLFVDGKILPQIPPLRQQNVKIDQLSSHSCPDRENSASKPNSKFSTRWKRFFKLENLEYFRAISKEADENANESSGPEAKPQRSRNFVSLFSRRRGQRPRWNGLFCVLPFSRKKRVAQRKSVEVQIVCKETQNLVLSSNPATATGLNNGGLMEVESFSQSNRLMKSPIRNYSRSSPGGLMIQNLEFSNCVTRTEDQVLVKGFDSPPPGKTMGERLLKNSSVKSKAGMKPGPVLNTVEPPLFGNAIFSRKQSRVPRQTQTQFYYYKRNNFKSRTRCSPPIVSDHKKDI
ncbi:hypothetical protein SUGI_0121440, partial [Cryptomeria japonica]